MIEQIINPQNINIIATLCLCCAMYLGFKRQKLNIRKKLQEEQREEDSTRVDETEGEKIERAIKEERNKDIITVIGVVGILGLLYSCFIANNPVDKVIFFPIIILAIYFSVLGGFVAKLRLSFKSLLSGVVDRFNFKSEDNREWIKYYIKSQYILLDIVFIISVIGYFKIL